VQESQEAAEQLVTLGGLHSLGELIKQPASEPLPLSLMLDIMEVLVSRGEPAVASEVRQMLVRDGLLAPLLLSLQHRGLSLKAVAILTHMVEVCPSSFSLRCSLVLLCASLHFESTGSNISVKHTLGVCFVT
jgi:hypothetical protein